MNLVTGEALDFQVLYILLRSLGRCGVLMVTALNSRSRCPGTSPGQEHCVVFSTQINLSVSTRAVIGQFSGPYFTVRPAKLKVCIGRHAKCLLKKTLKHI